MFSLHRTMLVMTMIVSALLNFGINGVQYGIQLHLVSAGMNGAYIGFINTGIFCAMLAGAFIANRMSDRLPAGPVVCFGFLFSCLAMVPLVCTSNYWVMLICDSLSALPFPIINAMMLGFVSAKAGFDAGTYHGDVDCACAGAFHVLQCCGGKPVAGVWVPSDDTGVPDRHDGKRRDCGALPSAAHDSPCRCVGQRRAAITLLSNVRFW